MGVLLSIVQYDAASRSRLEAEARAVLRDPGSRKAGASSARHDAYLAGRAAVSLGFKRLGWDAFVDPHPILGFLEVTPKGGTKAGFTNISHTRDMAVAAFADGPIGIDIEAVGRDATRAIQRVSTPEELKAIQGKTLSMEGGDVPATVALWSAKEAVSKATGLGIKFGMQDFVIFFKGLQPYPADVRCPGPQVLKDPAVRLLRAGEYVIALCAERAALADEPTVIKSVLRTRGCSGL